MSDTYEYHLFHGFLGDPSDWDKVSKELKSAGCEVFSHSLLDDYKKLSGELSFQSWAEYKFKQLQERPGKKVLIGYSLGGRLLSHLPAESFEKLFVLAGHPGLEQQQLERIHKDGEWELLLRQVSPEDWLRQWNEQVVFKSDQCRPVRHYNKETLEIFVRIQQAFSLGRQQCRDLFYSENRHKVYWFFGEKDAYYTQLEERMCKALGREQVVRIAQAGHGLLFDQPQWVAQEILKKVKDVS